MYYLGVDLGGTNIAIGVVDDNGTIVYKESIETLREREFQDIIKDMAALSLKVIKKAGFNIEDIRSIGIGSPGVADCENGILVYANNLRFKNAPLRMELQKYINLPVFIENDANCAALAESVAGAAKGAKNSVTITIGTGIGSGVVIDGKIYSGFNNAAVELGHTYLIYQGKECTCGKKGCWEAYSSATALIEQTKVAAINNPHSLINIIVNGNINNISAKTAFDAARQEDATAISVIEQYTKYLAAGLSNTINIFQPEILVIGGGVCNQGEYLLQPVRRLVEKELFSNLQRRTEIKVAQMGNDAGIVGAAMLGVS